ncbi:carbohydrate sulfotransferase 7 [Nothoprocta perdicaria]|nr:carbohydrate sulfotransferase 7 [Nothoprocta perdicaria]
MKARRRWRGRRRRFAALLLLYTLLLLLLLPYVLDYGAWRGRADEEPLLRRCPSLEAALSEWGWEQRAPQGDGGDGDDEGDEEGVAAAGGNGSAAARKRHIYLHATWRTGSSFLGELFNQHPDVFYLYEPMWHLWQALYPGDALSLQGALRDMVRALFRCDFSVLRLYAAPPAAREPPAAVNLTTAGIFGWRTNKVICSAPLCPAAPRPRHEIGLIDGAACEERCPPRALRELEAECRKYPVVVIKDVRLLELGALQPLLREPGLNLRVIQLFRDPRAVHNSRLKAKQALLRESIQVLRSRQRAEPRGPPRQHLLLPPPLLGGARPPPGPQHRAEHFLGGALEVICQGWLGDLLLARRAPAWLRRRYTQLRYEDLVREPRAQLRRLLRFAGLPVPPAMEAFVVNMTRGADYSSERPFLISARDAREAIHAWRERLSRQQVRQVEAACGEAMSLLAYPLSSGDTR